MQQQIYQQKNQWSTIKVIELPNKRGNKIASANSGKIDKRQDEIEIFCWRVCARNIAGVYADSE